MVYICFILFSFHKLSNKVEKFNSDYFLLIALFYFILKFTRISEFGVNLPSSIFSILAIYYFIKFSEKDIQKKK